MRTLPLPMAHTAPLLCESGPDTDEARLRCERLSDGAKTAVPVSDCILHSNRFVLARAVARAGSQILTAPGPPDTERLRGEKKLALGPWPPGH